jgi:hypothetical protein
MPKYLIASDCIISVIMYLILFKANPLSIFKSDKKKLLSD